MKTVREIETIQSLLQVDRIAESRTTIPELVARSGALLEGHFALQSGDHSQYFLRFKPIGWEPQSSLLSARLLTDMASSWIKAANVGTVICPESAGVFLGTAVARSLGVPVVVAVIDSARRPTEEIRTGVVVPRRAALIVNDVVTTGASVKVLERIALRNEAPVLGTLAFACRDRDAWYHSLERRGSRGVALVATLWPTYPSFSCPICATNELLMPATEFN